MNAVFGWYNFTVAELNFSNIVNPTALYDE